MESGRFRFLWLPVVVLGVSPPPGSLLWAQGKDPGATQQALVIEELEEAVSAARDPVLRSRILFILDTARKAGFARSSALGIDANLFNTQMAAVLSGLLREIDALKALIEKLRAQTGELPDELDDEAFEILRSVEAKLATLVFRAPTPSQLTPYDSDGDGFDREDTVGVVADYLLERDPAITREIADGAVDAYREGFEGHQELASGLPLIDIQPRKLAGSVYRMEFPNAPISLNTSGERTHWFSILNTGTADLIVEEVTLSQGDFFWLSTPQDRSARLQAIEKPLSIPPGGRKVLILNHLPAEGATLYLDQMRIRSNAVNEGVLAVSLVAMPFLPLLDLPEILNFGELEVDQVAELPLRIAYQPKISSGPLPALDVAVALELGSVFTLEGGKGGSAVRRVFRLDPDGEATLTASLQASGGGSHADEALVWIYPEGRSENLAAPVASVPLVATTTKLPSSLSARIDEEIRGGQRLAVLRIALDPPRNVELGVQQTVTLSSGFENTTRFVIETGEDGNYERILGGYVDANTFTNVRNTSGTNTWRLELSWEGTARYAEAAAEFEYEETPLPAAKLEPVPGIVFHMTPSIQSFGVLRSTAPPCATGEPVSWFCYRFPEDPDPCNPLCGLGRAIHSVYEFPVTISFPGVSVPEDFDVRITKAEIYIDSSGAAAPASETPGNLSPLAGAVPPTRTSWVKLRCFEARDDGVVGGVPQANWFSAEPAAEILLGGKRDCDDTLATLSWDGRLEHPEEQTAGDFGRLQRLPGSQQLQRLGGLVFLEVDLRRTSGIWTAIGLGLQEIDSPGGAIGALRSGGEAAVRRALGIVEEPPVGGYFDIRVDVIGSIQGEPFIHNSTSERTRIAVQEARPHLTVQPNSVQGGLFMGAPVVTGEAPPDHISRHRFRLANIGSAPLRIDRIEVLGAEGPTKSDALTLTKPFSADIPANDATDADLTFSFRPLEANRRYAGRLRIVGEDTEGFQGPDTTLVLPWFGLGIAPLTLLVAHPKTVSRGMLTLKPVVSWNSYLGGLSQGPLQARARLQFSVEAELSPEEVEELDRQTLTMGQYELSFEFTQPGRVVLTFVSERPIRPGTNGFQRVDLPLPELGGTPEGPLLPVTGEIEALLTIDGGEEIELNARHDDPENAEFVGTTYRRVSRSLCPGGRWMVKGSATGFWLFVSAIHWELAFECASNPTVTTSQNYFTLGVSTGRSMLDGFQFDEGAVELAPTTGSFDSWFSGALVRVGAGLDVEVGKLRLGVASAGGGFTRCIYWGGSFPELNAWWVKIDHLFRNRGVEEEVAAQAKKNVNDLLKDELKEASETMKRLLEDKPRFEYRPFRDGGVEPADLRSLIRRKLKFELGTLFEFGWIVGQPVSF